MASRLMVLPDAARHSCYRCPRSGSHNGSDCLRAGHESRDCDPKGRKNRSDRRDSRQDRRKSHTGSSSTARDNICSRRDSPKIPRTDRSQTRN